MRERWVRDGTLMVGGSTQIDLRSTRKPHGPVLRMFGVRYRNYNWISVKGATDAESERIAALLLRLLNGEE
jgi:predicted secreted Zn-dependent protease